MRVVELDLLRFFAAFGVVLYHYVAWFVLNHPKNSYVLEHLETVTRYGYLGVPAFFTISGFVILASAMNRNNIEFAVSRVTRLFPVYWVCVSLTAFSIFFTGSGNDLLNMGMYLVNLTMLQSFVGVASVDGVYWTLAKELQFYGCVFLLLTFRVIHHVRVWLSIWLLLTLVYKVFSQPFFMGMFISPEYSPFFIAGVALYMIRHEGPSFYYRLVLGLAIVLASFSIYDVTEEMTNYDDAYVKWVSIAITNLIFVIFYAISVQKIKLEIKPVYLVIGGLTYPLYLIHNVAGKIIMDKIVEPLGPELSILVSVILMLSVSFVLYQYYEKRVSSQFKKSLLVFVQKFDNRNSSR